MPFLLRRADIDIHEINVITLMKERLPEYIANCLIASGYDEMQVLCDMNTSETPKNAIEKVESFINKKFSDKPEYNPTLSLPFEFPPGHRARICNFIQELKQLRENAKRKTVANHKSSKRRKISRSYAELSGDKIDLTDDAELSVVNIETVSKQVRSNLRNWATKQSEVKLQEGVHYSLKISPKESPGFFLVSLRCAKCNIFIQLHQKDHSDCTAPYLISNFTRHVKLCFTKNAAKKHSESLHKFFSETRSKTNQDCVGSSSDPIATVSAKHASTDIEISLESSPSTSSKDNSSTFISNTNPESSDQVF